MRTLILLSLTTLVGCKKPVESPVETAVATPPACGLQADGSRVFRVLHLNDVYRIEGLADGRGGLARVRTLREQLESDCPDGVLLTHAGDALFPSLLSRTRKGAQMVAVLNLLDGAAGQADPRMVATFGNHEFDKSKLKYSSMLQARIDESEFTWLDTNIVWGDGEAGPLIAADNLQDQLLVEVGGVKVGVFSLTLDAKIPAYVSHIDTDYAGVARTRTADLREQGAEVVIGLTHIDAGDDLALLETLGDSAPDMLLGGHDHTLMSGQVGGRMILKGDADAGRVRTAEFRVFPDGRVSFTVDQDGVHLTPETMPADPQVQAVVDAELQAFEQAFCAEQGPGCLSRPLTRAGVDLHAEETTIRRFETNLGDWVADRMLDTFPDADLALVNSGALRLNQDIGAGTAITRQVVEELFAYPAQMHRIRIDGATLRSALERSVQNWTGQGHFLQVAGISFEHDPDRTTVGRIAILADGEPKALDPAASYDVVTVRYLLDPAIGDQDGYRMLSLDQIVDDPQNGTDLKEVVLAALTDAADTGISPKVEGRICNPQRPGPCAASKP